MKRISTEDTYSLVFKFILRRSTLQFKIYCIIQYSSTVYRDYEGLEFLALKYHTKNQLKIYFVTPRQDWLGIAKCLDTTINPSTKLMISFF